MNKISRRSLFKGAGLMVGAATVGAGLAWTATKPTTPKHWYELGVSGDPIMDDQSLFFLSQTVAQQADVGEVLATASRLREGNETGWFDEWLKTAQRVHKIAAQSLAQGHTLSAGHTFLRAGTYYRAALIRYADYADPRLKQACVDAVSCYDTANALLHRPAQAVKIPYEGTTLPGYFHRSPVASGKAPIILLHQGLHAWPEDTAWVTDGALERGYHVLAFQGPGQGLALRFQGLTYRPDWEKVVTPVVDFALNLPGVDASKLILKGLSFGGALAPRAAAFEHRLRLCIANPGVLNWGEAMYDHFDQYPGLLNLLKSNPQDFDNVVGLIAKTWPSAAWYFKDAGWKHGAKSPADLFTKLGEFNNEPVADKIQCQMLIMDGTGEAFSVGQAQRLYDAVKAPKHYMQFTAEDTGLLHCQAGAYSLASQRMFDWMDENI